GDQRARTEILAAFDGMHARGIGHVLVDELAHAKGSMLHREVERLADIGGERAFGAAAIERHLAAGKSRRIDAAEREVGIGHRRLTAAAAIADRAGLRAGAVRADADASQRVDAGNRAAAGAISTISITGMRSGSPLPFTKR